jgi:hypothetical protein
MQKCRSTCCTLGGARCRYAETAVALIDKDVRALVAPEAFPITQLEEAQRLLREAKEARKGKDGAVAGVGASKVEE